VLDRCDFGVSITTRYSLLLRDMDILKELARKTKVVVMIPLPTLQTEQFRLIEGELGVSERLRLIDGLAKEGIETILLLDPIIPKINDTTTTLGMLLQMAKDYHIRMVDHRDMKCQLQNGSREYFYKELSRRDRELAQQLLSIYGEENELIPEKQKELLAYLFDSCKANDIICDRKEILTYSRKYENRTEGVQLSLMDMLQ
jgi:DNA repair photolyase